MEQFNLDTWLQDMSRKVVTRDGRNVRIICTDRKTSDCQNIIGLAQNPYNVEQLLVSKTDGSDVYKQKENDLFFADKEEKQQSIEIPFGAFDSEFIKDEYSIPEGCEARIEGNKVIIEKIQKEEELTEFEKEVNAIIDENIKMNIGLKYEARNLLDLARKELIEELSDDNFAIDFALTKGKQDALQEFPKIEDTKAYQEGVKEGRRLERQDIDKELDEAYKSRDEVVYLEGMIKEKRTS